MRAYKKRYLESIGAGEQDVIICELCRRKPATDIHHIIMKGMGGSRKLDGLDNLIALDRQCHDKAHGLTPWGRNEMGTVENMQAIAQRRIDSQKAGE